MLAKPPPNVPKSPLPAVVRLSKTSVCFLNSLSFPASFLFPLVCSHLTPTPPLPFFLSPPPPSYITMITNLMDNWWVFLFLYFFLLFIFFSGKEVFILGWMAFEKIGSRKFKCVTRGSRLLDRSPLRRFSWLIFPLIGSNRVKTWSSTLQIDDCGLREKLYPLTCFVLQSNCI